MNKSLEVLKITRGILLKSIVDLETQIAEMEKPATKKWEPKGGKWWIDGCGSAGKSDTNDESRLFGHERETLQSAELAAVEMRKFNRLLAYRDEFAPGYEFVPGGNNCYVYYAALGKWCYSVNMDSTAITVYMPPQVASDLIDKLNSGEVVL